MFMNIKFAHHIHHYIFVMLWQLGPNYLKKHPFCLSVMKEKIVMKFFTLISMQIINANSFWILLMGQMH